MASWSGGERVKAILARLPTAVKEAVDRQLATEAKELAEAIKRAAPVGDELEKTPGQLRDSVHAYKADGRELTYRVLADAKDAKGNFIGPHVEFGHLARDGSHVPPSSFFFPTYRARKKAMKRRINKAGRDAIKAVAGDLAKD